MTQANHTPSAQDVEAVVKQADKIFNAAVDVVNRKFNDNDYAKSNPGITAATVRLFTNVFDKMGHK